MQQKKQGEKSVRINKNSVGITCGCTEHVVPATTPSTLHHVHARPLVGARLLHNRVDNLFSLLSKI